MAERPGRAREPGRLPARLWIAAKYTIRPRDYESIVVELGVEVDAGTPAAEVQRLVAEADAAYAILQEKVAARAFQARQQAAVEDGRVGGGDRHQPSPAQPPVGRADWTSQPGGPRPGSGRR